MPVSGTITRVAGVPIVTAPPMPRPPPIVENSGDGGPATEAQLSAPNGLAVSADGGFLIATAPVVRKVSGSGTITLAAGDNTRGNSGDGGPATDAQLSNPVGLAVTPDGGFLISDDFELVVREVSASGVIRRVAGTGGRGSSGDDGPATDAQLNVPEDVAVTPDGGFLIADTENSVIRKVSPSGIITRVAGTGTPGNSGDDGVAADAQLNGPVSVAAAADGSFLIADAFACVVRMVSAEGVITRVAGTGIQGSGGDDGPATEAQLNAPRSVALTADGGILIADTGNNVVRKVSPNGIITRVAGTGTPGDSGDGGPATEAQLSEPVALAVTADGGFLIAGDHLVRKVWP